MSSFSRLPYGWLITIWLLNSGISFAVTSTVSFVNQWMGHAFGIQYSMTLIAPTFVLTAISGIVAGVSTVKKMPIKKVWDIVSAIWQAIEEGINAGFIVWGIISVIFGILAVIMDHEQFQFGLNLMIWAVAMVVSIAIIGVTIGYISGIITGPVGWVVTATMIWVVGSAVKVFQERGFSQGLSYIILILTIGLGIASGVGAGLLRS